MKRIRVSNNRVEVIVAIRESLLSEGHAVSDIFNDTDDTPTVFNGGLVFTTDSDEIVFPIDCAELVNFSPARETDPEPTERRTKTAPAPEPTPTPAPTPEPEPEPAPDPEF